MCPFDTVLVLITPDYRLVQFVLICLYKHRLHVRSYVLAFVYTLRPSQNGRRFSDDIFKRIFLNENVWVSIKSSLKFVPKGSISNIPALVQIMAWRRPGDKPLSEPMIINLLTEKCVTRPQWVNETVVNVIFIQTLLYQIRVFLIINVLFMRINKPAPMSSKLLNYVRVKTFHSAGELFHLLWNVHHCTQNT